MRHYNPDFDCAANDWLALDEQERIVLGAPVGAMITLAAVALFISAVRTFRAAETPIPGNRPTTTIVRAGPIASPGTPSTWR